MPKQIELCDISALDSFNKQRACGGHQGQGCGQWGLAQYPEEGVRQGGEGRRCGVIVMSASVMCNHR